MEYLVFHTLKQYRNSQPEFSLLKLVEVNWLNRESYKVVLNTSENTKLEMKTVSMALVRRTSMVIPHFPKSYLENS